MPRYDWLYFKPGVTLMGKTKLRFLAIVSSLLFAPVGMGQSGNPPTGSDDAIAQVKTLGYSGEGEHRFRKKAERRSGAKVNSSRSEATLAW